MALRVSLLLRLAQLLKEAFNVLATDGLAGLCVGRKHDL